MRSRAKRNTYTDVRCTCHGVSFTACRHHNGQEDSFMKHHIEDRHRRDGRALCGAEIKHDAWSNLESCERCVRISAARAREAAEKK